MQIWFWKWNQDETKAKYWTATMRIKEQIHMCVLNYPLFVCKKAPSVSVQHHLQGEPIDDLNGHQKQTFARYINQY